MYVIVTKDSKVYPKVLWAYRRTYCVEKLTQSRCNYFKSNSAIRMLATSPPVL